MSYERLNIQNHVDKWDIEKVKHLEDGIVANEEAIANLDGGVQSDWNQNDENAANYIKNRPFYSEVKNEYLFSTTIARPESDVVVNLGEIRPVDCTVGADVYVEKSVLFITVNDVIYRAYYNINCESKWRPVWTAYGDDMMIIVQAEPYDTEYWSEVGKWTIQFRFWDSSAIDSEQLDLSFTFEYSVTHKIPQDYMPEEYLTPWDLQRYLGEYAPDWDVSSSHETGYIQNRTHYKYTYVTDCCEKQPCVFSQNDDGVIEVNPSIFEVNYIPEFYHNRGALSKVTVTFYNANNKKLATCESRNGTGGPWYCQWLCYCSGLSFTLNSGEHELYFTDIVNNSNWLTLDAEIYVSIQLEVNEITQLPDFYLSSDIAKKSTLQWSDVGTTQAYKKLGSGGAEDSCRIYGDVIQPGDIICFDMSRSWYSDPYQTYTWHVDNTLSFDCPDFYVRYDTYEETPCFIITAKYEYDEFNNKVFTCYKPELWTTIDEKYIPDTVARAPKATLEDVTEAPTAEQYNALLDILRQAGILA